MQEADNHADQSVKATFANKWCAKALGQARRLFYLVHLWLVSGFFCGHIIAALRRAKAEWLNMAELRCLLQHWDARKFGGSAGIVSYIQSS